MVFVIQGWCWTITNLIIYIFSSIQTKWMYYKSQIIFPFYLIFLFISTIYISSCAQSISVRQFHSDHKIAKVTASSFVPGDCIRTWKGFLYLTKRLICQVINCSQLIDTTKNFRWYHKCIISLMAPWYHQSYFPYIFCTFQFFFCWNNLSLVINSN